METTIVRMLLISLQVRDLTNISPGEISDRGFLLCFNNSVTALRRQDRIRHRHRLYRRSHIMDANDMCILQR